MPTGLKRWLFFVMNVEQTKHDIRMVSSQSQDWVIKYLAHQSTGLAKLACEDRDPKLFKFNKDTIEIARFLRQELLRRFDLVLFGRYCIMHRDGTLYESPSSEDHY